jgi:hypothetical protein
MTSRKSLEQVTDDAAPAHEPAWRAEFSRLRSFPRNIDSRRFLASLLLTSRYHVASRPLSYSNLGWFASLAEQCDVLLHFLREGEWEPLSVPVEDGLLGLETIAPLIPSWASDRDARRATRRRWNADFHTRFGSLSVNWSRRTPTDRLQISDWPQPRRILVIIGPNIGIGDQLIYFPIVEALAARFSAARVDAVSYTSALWDLCPSVAKPTSRVRTLVGPFVLAREAMAEEPTTLVVFSEFASAPFYRNLETVPGLPRFVYFDTGARCLRIVDQERGLIREWQGRPSENIFQFCCHAMNWLGLGQTAPAHYGPVVAGSARAKADVRRVYVNPFSSKDHSTIRPTFWAGALDEAAKRGPIHANIFAGTNDECRRFARAIASSVTSNRVTVSHHGEAEVPSVLETLEAAADADVCFGLDTYTAHINVFRPVRSLVVFFEGLGGTWDAWRSPHTGVLNSTVHDSPVHVGRLLGRLLFDEQDKDVTLICEELMARHRRLSAIASGNESGAARHVLQLSQEIEALVRRWASLDADVELTFGDMDPVLAEPLMRLFRLSVEIGGDAQLEGALLNALSQGLRLFGDTNLLRYVRLVSSLEHRAVAPGV